MAVFRWRHFGGEIILWAVRWYCRYGISYRELEEMMGERGVAVDHTTLYRWTQHYAPELEKRSAWYRSRMSFSWRVDETCAGERPVEVPLPSDRQRWARRSTSTSPTGAMPRPPSASFLPP
jgi:hypothetical protein